MMSTAVIRRLGFDMIAFSFLSFPSFLLTIYSMILKFI